jgi:hypothetical protein
MSKNQSNGNTKVGWILDSSLTVKQFPTAANLTANALDLSAAISWKNFKAGADVSADIQDRSLVDLGSSVSRGAAKYGATIGMFRDLNNLNNASVYVQAFQAFRTAGVIGWLVLRHNKAATLPWAAGDEISLLKLMVDTTENSRAGEDSTKFIVTFLSQGALFAHSMVGGAGVITGVPTTLAKTVASGAFQLQPVVGTTSIVSRATYSSSNTSLATVSTGGTVVPIAPGSPTITTSYGAASASVVTTVTLT